MGPLEQYRKALLAALPEVPVSALLDVLKAAEPSFVDFIISHGLGPLWHARSERKEFRESRLMAEALYLAQCRAMHEVDEALEHSGIEYAVIKGAANRELLYENPAIRACWDIDLLVRRADRVAAAAALVGAGYRIDAKALNISHELTLSRGMVDIDLHWGILREGRLKTDLVADMLRQRRRAKEQWILNAEDGFFIMLVHPAFAKHLGGWEMGLHRVMDTMALLRTQELNWHAVRARLELNGVKTGAWATLRWVELVSFPSRSASVSEMLADLSPGPLRRAYLDRWLLNDWTGRMAAIHRARLLCFSAFLHDTLRDSARAFSGRWQAHKNSEADLSAFRALLG